MLSRFLSDETLVITVTFSVEQSGGMSQEKIEETQEGLHELKLSSALKLD